jgi:membrane protein DedA with SNARE-associated domain
MLADRLRLILCLFVFPPVVAALATLGTLDGGGNFLFVGAAAGVLSGVVLGSIFGYMRGRAMGAVFGQEEEVGPAP